VVPVNQQLLDWIRAQCCDFVFRPAGVYLKSGDHPWPLVAHDDNELEIRLEAGGHLTALPKESAALANVIEVALVDFLIDRISRLPGAVATRGGERSYPDLEVGGAAFGGGFHAVDVKMARLNKNGYQTQSRCTLYTGNTYFRFPDVLFAGMLRSFADYESHLDILGVYRLDLGYRGRVRDLELLVHEPWRIASKERSSTTREYIGAVIDVESLREGRGVFETEADFYSYWRAFPFKTGKEIEKQLRKALQAAKATQAPKAEEAARRAAEQVSADIGGEAKGV
jgi:hypothetical protein